MRYRFLSALLALAAVGLAGCGSSSSQLSDEEAAAKAAAIVAGEPLKEYSLRGEVMFLDSAANVAKIRHEEIGDDSGVWMGAMTMDFPVREDAEFAKLQEGEAIEATLHVQGLQFWIDDVRPASAEAAPAPAPAQ